MRVRARSAVYVLRDTPAGKQALIFGDDCLQVPAGGIDPGETPAEAAVREVEEESGVRLTGRVRRVHVSVGQYTKVGVWRVTHFFVADAPPGLPEAWPHTVTGEGEEVGRTHRCRWLPVDRLDRLASGLDAGAFAALHRRDPAPADAAVRLATPADAPFIAGLRNQAIRESTAIYTDQQLPADAVAAWFDRDMTRHPITIAQRDGDPVGYGMLGPYNDKCGYAGCAENSVYVADHAHRRGVGSALLGDLLERGRSGGLHTVLARIDSSQKPSLGLHLRHGFTPVGVLREAGEKFGRKLDVVYLQAMLRDTP